MDDKTPQERYQEIYMFQLLIMFFISQLCLKFTTLSNTIFRLTNRINRTCECQAICPICIEKIVSSNNVLITECSHKYHVNCFIEYIKKNRKRDIECPYCRKVLYEGEEIEEDESNTQEIEI